MKRTTLMVDEELLAEALRVSGERTYSATVNLALQELVRRASVGRILELAGSGLWEGDLSAMRADRAVREGRHKARKKKPRRGPR